VCEREREKRNKTVRYINNSLRFKPKEDEFWGWCSKRDKLQTTTTTTTKTKQKQQLQVPLFLFKKPHPTCLLTKKWFFVVVVLDPPSPSHSLSLSLSFCYILSTNQRKLKMEEKVEEERRYNYGVHPSRFNKPWMNLPKILTHVGTAKQFLPVGSKQKMVAVTLFFVGRYLLIIENMRGEIIFFSLVRTKIRPFLLNRNRNWKKKKKNSFFFLPK
jgi:hypothetical protein